MNIGLGIGIPFTRSSLWASIFTPSALFLDGSTQGVWYDPSDIATLFQDPAGTQPVTAVEQPVGLMLDKSKGLVPGSELITNAADRDFSSDTGWWTKTVAGVSIGSGVCSWNASGGGINRADLCTSNKWYVVKYTITSFISGSAIRFYAKGNQTTLRSSVGTYAEYILCGSTGPEVGWYSTGSSTCSIDNVSIQELPGNHAFNPSGNSANFPVLSARYNLLTKTEDISAADWTKAGTVTASTSSLLETATTGTHSCYLSPTTVAATYIYSVKLKANGRTRLAIAGTSSFGGNLGSGVFFDLGTGSYVSGATGTPSITALADDWYQVSYTWTAFAASGVLGIFLVDSGTNISYSGDVTKGMLIKEADLRVANDALNQPAYQRVNTATDYDTVGFKPYVRFNGVSQWLQTNSIDFTYGDKMFVCAGVRKLSDAAIGAVLELSTNSNTNNGAIWLLSPGSPATDQHSFRSKGTSAADANSSGYPAPISNVISGVGNISGDQTILRVNGTQAASSAADQGTGNYGNYPLYIGARAGSSLFFNGRLYQLVIAAGSEIRVAEEDSDLFLSESGDFITAETTVAVIQSAIEQTEAFVNRKTSAF